MRRPTARRCSRGSSRPCPTATRNCCARCSPTQTWKPDHAPGGADMRVAVYIPLLIPVLAALAARPLGSRLPPPAATWLLAVSTLVLALLSSAVLGMLALSALVRVAFIDAVGHMSAAVIRGGDAVSLPVALLAGGLLALPVTAACRALWRRGAAIAAAHRRACALPGTGQVVVTADAAADSYTIPGWPCRIVITRGVLAAQPGAER